MIRTSVYKSLRFALAAGTAFAVAAPVAAETVDFLDLNAGRRGVDESLPGSSSHSSAFGRVSLTGTHSISSEHGSTTLNGYIENTTYLQDYGSKQIFALSAHASRALSPTAESLELSIFREISLVSFRTA